MNLQSKNLRRMSILGVVACATQFVAMNTSFADEQPEGSSAPAPAPAAESKVSNLQDEGGSSVDGESSVPAEWVIHMHGVVGSARTTSVDGFESDRLGAAVFAGTILSDFELPLFLADAKEFTLGLSYQTFTGVSVSQNEAIALQALGAQARFVLAPSFLSGADLSVHSGLALQRIVSEDQADGLEKAQTGGALTAGAYVRWLVLGPIAVLAGADLVAGNASWGGVSAGVEASF